MMNEISFNKAYEELKADFRAAKSTRFAPRLRGVDTLGSGADYHYRHERDFLHMIERAREFERNDMLVGQALNRLTSNVIQDGFSPDPQTGDGDLDSALKSAWHEWCDTPEMCHSEQEFNFYTLERLAFRSIVRDGDIFVLPHRSGAIQLVEAHRARTPLNTSKNVVNGVLIDSQGRRLQIWFAKEDTPTNRMVQRVSEIKAYNVRDSEGHRQILQLYFPKRSSQRRGITALAPCSDTIGQHDDLQFSTLVKAQLASLVVLLEERDIKANANVSGPGLSAPNTGQYTETTSSQIPGLAAGLHFKTAPGHKMSGFTPNIPNAEFFPHAMLLLTFIAVNLDMPVQMLLLDPKQTNFSGWRAAVDQARVRFREMQNDMIRQFHRPIWRWKVRQWIESDREIATLAARVANPFAHTWKRPTWPYIDPLKDSQADQLQVQSLLTSPRRKFAARGEEHDEVVREIVEDNKLLLTYALDAAADLQAKYPGAGIDWRVLLNPVTAIENTQMSQIDNTDLPQEEAV